MSDADSKDCEVRDQIARLGKAFSSPTRLQIIDMLSQAPRTVEALAEAIGQSTANTSHHLRKLRQVRLVDVERDGVHMIYRLADDEVMRAYGGLCSLAEQRLLEVREFLRSFAADDEMDALEPEELLERARRGEVTVLDVRPAEEYEAGHLPGAVSIPIDELEQRLEELPQEREVVAYCRGPYCALSLEAVDLLREQGYEVRRFTRGVFDWRDRGLPVEQEDTAS